MSEEADALFRAADESPESVPYSRFVPAPGRLPATARLGTVVILRKEDGSTERLRRDSNGVTAGADAAVALASSSSSGASLPDDVRGRFESSLGADLSGVRVHTGAESAAAASAVGAKAYTIGNDIHFAEGRYAQSDPFGVHLLAHEVAHTVQQSGAPSRQYKLEVSTPGDAAEVEADRAADAMVGGQPTAVTPGPSVLHRSDDKDKDKAWAEDARNKERAVKAAAGGAAQRLNADAQAALSALQAALGSYSGFESRYNEAVARFTTGCKEAMAKAAELREYLHTAVEIAFGVASGGLSEEAEGLLKIGETASEYLETAEKVGTLVGVQAAESKPPEVKAAPSGLDWKVLISQSIDTLQKYITQNQSLTAIGARCDASEIFLSSVVEGTAPTGAKTSGDGQAADKIAQGSDAAIAQLGSITAGAVSAGATKFRGDCAAHLDPVTSQKLEQDIAMKWIAGLSQDQIDAIGDAQSYLRSIGVIGDDGSVLGLNTHPLWATDNDEKIIWMRAQMKTAAEALVGKEAQWLGGTKLGLGGGVSGTIKDDGGDVWNAGGPGTLSEQPGGQVLVNAYRMQEVGDEHSEWSHPGDMAMRQLIHDQVSFSVSPTGPTGAGGVQDGPSIGPGAGGRGGE